MAKEKRVKAVNVFENEKKVKLKWSKPELIVLSVKENTFGSNGQGQDTRGGRS